MPSEIAVISLTQVIFALIFELAFWGRSVPPIVLLGMVLILAPTAWIAQRARVPGIARACACARARASGVMPVVMATASGLDVGVRAVAADEIGSRHRRAGRMMPDPHGSRRGDMCAGPVELGDEIAPRYSVTRGE